MTLKPFYAKLKSLAKLQIGLVSVLFVFSTHAATSQIQDKQATQDSTEDNQVHFLVQEMPVFPGNLNTWYTTTYAIRKPPRRKNSKEKCMSDSSLKKMEPSAMSKLFGVFLPNWTTRQKQLSPPCPNGNRENKTVLRACFIHSSRLFCPKKHLSQRRKKNFRQIFESIECRRRKIKERP